VRGRSGILSVLCVAPCCDTGYFVFRVRAARSGDEFRNGWVGVSNVGLGRRLVCRFSLGGWCNSLYCSPLCDKFRE